MKNSLMKIWSAIEDLCFITIKYLFEMFSKQTIMAKEAPIRQFIRFCFVGVTSAVVLFITYGSIVLIVDNYFIGNCVGFFTSTLNSYLWNRAFVFNIKHEVKNFWIGYLKSILLYSFTGLILSNVLLYIWIDLLNINVLTAPIINICLMTPLNFLLNKFWTFKKK